MTSNDSTENKKNIIDNDDFFNLSVKNQNYCIMALRYNEDNIIDSFKTRAIFKTEERAIKQIKDFYDNDKKKHGGMYPNFYVKVGEWNAIDLNFNNMKDGTKQEERVKKANKLGREYLLALKYDRKDELKRQEEMKGKKSSIVVVDKDDVPDVNSVENNEINEKDDNAKNMIEENYNNDALDEDDLNDDDDDLNEDDLNNDKKYLFADAPVQYYVKEQLYYSVSLLSNESFPTNYKHLCSDPNIVLIKVKCCYSNEDDGREKTEYFEKKDPRYDVAFADIGRWYDIKYSIDKVQTEEGIVYENDDQNKYMKGMNNNKEEKEDEDNCENEETDVITTKTVPQKIKLEENLILESINQIDETKEKLKEELDIKNENAKLLEKRIEELERKSKLLHT